MQLITLEIKDDFFEKFLNVLDALPHGMVNLRRDKLRKELTKRVEDIDNGTEKVTPYLEGMDDMLQRVKNRYADS